MDAVAQARNFTVITNKTIVDRASDSYCWTYSIFCLFCSQIPYSHPPVHDPRYLWFVAFSHWLAADQGALIPATVSFVHVSDSQCLLHLDHQSTETHDNKNLHTDYVLAGNPSVS